MGTNRVSLLSLKSKFPRDNEIEQVNSFLLDNSMQSSLVYVTGKAGMGKSNFLIDYFSFLDSPYSYLYFVNENDDDEKTLSNIYLDLKQRFRLCLFDCPKEINAISNIRDELSITEKISRIFEIYSQYFARTNKSFVLFIDGVDLLNNEENILKKLIQDIQGVNYIISGRENGLESYLKRFKTKSDGFIYKELELLNLNKEHILKIIREELHCYESLTNKEQGIVGPLFIRKSEGLPLYLKYQIDTINKKVVAEGNIYNQVIHILENLPNKLGDFYIDIFENLSPISLNVLQVLYWHYEPVKIRFIQQILNLSDEVCKEALENISFLLNNDQIQESILICHLSVKESLFEFYKYQIDTKKQTAIKLNSDFIVQHAFNEHEILKYLAKSSTIIHNFSKTVYYSRDNILYTKLEEIVYFSLSQKNINSYFIDVFYNYLIINSFYDNILEEKVFDSHAKLHHIFIQSKTVDINLKRLGNKFLFHITKHHETDLFQIRKLLQISIFLNNNYFITKYTRSLFKYNNKKLLKQAYTEEILTSQNYKSLNTILLKSYLTRLRVLQEKKYDHQSLHLYDDSNLVLYVDLKKTKDSLESSLIKMIQRVINKPYQTYLSYSRVYDVIKFTDNNRLLKEFINILSKHVIYNKKAQKTTTDAKNLSELLKQVEYDFLIKNLDTFNKNDNKYKFLPTELKQKINRLLQLQNAYFTQGVEVILKDKYQDLVDDMTYILREKDSLIYYSFWNVRLEQEKSEFLLNQLLTRVYDHNILKEFENKIAGLGYESKGLLNCLLKIYYKLKEPEKLEKLKQSILKTESFQQERTLVLKLISNIEKGTFRDISDFSLVSNLNSVNILIKSDQLVFEEIEEIFVKVSEKNSTKTHNLLVSFFDYSTESLENKQAIFKKYEEYLDRNEKIKVMLNFSMLQGFESFKRLAKHMPVIEQVKYLEKNIFFLIQKQANTIIDEMFWQYFMSLFTTGSECLDLLEQLLQKVYSRFEFITFAKNNKEYVERKLQLFSNINNKIGWYFTVVNLVIDDESNYKRVFELSKINDDMVDEVTIMMFAFNATKMETILELISLVPKNDLLSLGKIKLYGGFKFNDNILIKEGFDIAFELNKMNVKYNLNNTIIYTLPPIINNESISELVKVFTIPEYQTSGLLKTLLDLAFYNNVNELEDDQAKNIFPFFNNIQSNSQIIKSILQTEQFRLIDFNHANKEEITELLLSLVDRYKQAEYDEDEELYNNYEVLFSEIKNSLDNKLAKDLFFDFERTTLDNLFDKYNFINQFTSEDQLNLNLLYANYNKFYDLLFKMYSAYTEAEENHDLELCDKISDEFGLLKEEILQDEEGFELIKKSSTITSKLQIKLSNIEKFKPRV